MARRVQIKNPLLFWSWAAVIAYIFLGVVLPTPIISQTLSFLLVPAGGVMAAIYADDAFDAVWRMKRTDDPEVGGAHLGIYGGFLVGAGAVTWGVSGLLWYIAGMPPSWIGTAWMAVGKGVMISGLVLMAWSPFVAAQPAKPSSKWSSLLVISMGVVVVFAAGWWSQSIVTDDLVMDIPVSDRAHRPVCRPDEPIWVSKSGVYHLPDSPYRRLVNPQLCYATEDEAIKAGFRPYDSAAPSNRRKP